MATPALLRLLSALLLLLLSSSGCGYRFAPGGDVSEDLESVYVRMFVNRTLEPFLEKQLTDGMIVGLQRGGRYQISEDRAGADLLMEGEVLSYSTAPLAYDREDNVTLYQSTLTARAVLRLRATGRVVWQGEASWRETYPRLDDKSLQRQAELAASKILVSRLADELYARLIERF